MENTMRSLIEKLESIELDEVKHHPYPQKGKKEIRRIDRLHNKQIEAFEQYSEEVRRIEEEMKVLLFSEARKERVSENHKIDRLQKKQIAALEAYYTKVKSFEEEIEVLRGRRDKKLPVKDLHFWNR